MNNFEVLSLAYQRQAEGATGTLSEIIEQVKSDLEAMQPPLPGANDEIGFKSEVVGGVRKKYKIMGDGSQVEVQQ